MRDIKFRSWNVVDKTMYNSIYNCKDSFEMQLKHPQIYKIMQYTGLKDINGTEIYEGDIISYKHITYTDCSKTKIEKIEDESFIEIITYAPIASIVKPHSKNVKCFGYDSFNKECLILDLTSDEVEVIGNIYENAELLEGNKTWSKLNSEKNVMVRGLE